MLIHLVVNQSVAKHVKAYPLSCREDTDYNVDSSVQEVLFNHEDQNTQYAVFELMTRMRWTPEMLECLVCCAEEALNWQRPTAGPYPYTRMGELLGNQLITEMRTMASQKMREMTADE